MMQRLAERTAMAIEGGTDRRSFLRKMALVGSALMTAPLDWVLRPVTAYAAICGPASECAQGYTVFCCTVNRGINRCPPGTFVGGWWKANNSDYCCDADGSPRARYIIDCHPECRCTTGCSGSAFCSSSCWGCKCRCNDGDTCDRRRVCCNVFRYGQCNTDIGCSGPVACRMITCTPPYLLYDECGTTLRTDDFTANHTAPCLVGPCT